MMFDPIRLLTAYVYKQLHVHVHVMVLQCVCDICIV